MSSINSKIIRVPARLSPGDTIGVAAPAGPFDHKTFERGTRILKDMGFKVVVPRGLLDAAGYLAGADDHRAKFVNQLFADGSIDAIICARGGYGSLRILTLLDYATIANNPKVFIGFSDITALLNVLFNRCGLVTFHGPVVTSLAGSPAETGHSLFQAVSSDIRLNYTLPEGKTVKSGFGAGVVCGGNLATLCHLVGTPFAPDFKGKILFLEDRAEAPYRIDRMLTHMQLAGCFEDLAGIVLGSFEDCGSMEDVISLVADAFADKPFPILAGLGAGHGKDNFTLPFGIPATLDADGHCLSYQQTGTMG